MLRGRGGGLANFLPDLSDLGTIFNTFLFHEISDVFGMVCAQAMYSENIFANLGNLTKICRSILVGKKSMGMSKQLPTHP
jgi:hypothetical protein